MGIRRDTIYNLIGSIIPMVVGIVTVPIYLRLVGDARYGVLALVWLFLGYFGLFDPGITRASLFHMARLSRQDQQKERESVFWTALAVNFVFGIVGGVLLFLIAKPLFLYRFKMPEEMRAEVLACMPWLAASVPVTIISGVLGGAMQAREAFDRSNRILTANAVGALLIPLAVAYFHGPDLRWLIPAVLITRIVGNLPMLLELRTVLPLGVGGRFDRAHLRSLFTYGGWVTISNLIAPLLASMDRVLIGSLVSAEAVAFYAVPFSAVSRLSVLPGALVSSLYPRFSRATPEEGVQLASDAVLALVGVMTPIVVGGIMLMPFAMQLWVGRTFAEKATPVAIALLCGMWINSLAYVPYEHLQATNRPDLVAKFHAAELLPFLGVLWLGTHFYGVRGAAWAWSLRVTVDAVLLFAVAGETRGRLKVLPGLALIALTLGTTAIGWQPLRLASQAAMTLVAIGWSWKVSPMLRTGIQKFLPQRRPA